MSFKHSKKSEELMGFEKKFYDAVVQMGTIICDATESKPKMVKFIYEGDGKKSFLVTLKLDASKVEGGSEYVQNYANILSKHFPAFFTPAHYRPYGGITTLVDGASVEIMASYSEGV